MIWPLRPRHTARSLARVIPATATLEGGGFLVHRPIPARGLEQVDPFLLLDEMGPMDHGPGEAEGAPDHPHKGFELITYLLAGEMEHLDSHGNHGILRAGDAQYMLGGTGLVHSEMPTEAFQRTRRPPPRLPDLGEPVQGRQSARAALQGRARRDDSGRRTRPTA